ncbi:hypothetical protein CMT37_18530 [Elizabethkingia anophelis]|nr:hypothetical protein [Elizabethkingia anophelis]
MDRNLGATSNTPNNVNTLGLLYQWGRKDPFPGAGSTTENIFRKIYNKDGAEISSPFIASTTDINTSVKNPLNFYSAFNGSSYNWLPQFNYLLWGSPDTMGYTKTIYDPCPEGWRVPAYKNNISPWEGVNISNGGVWNNGFTWPGHGGYYPATGHRGATSQEIFDVGKVAFYHLSNHNSDFYSARMYIIFSTEDKQVIPFNVGHPARGFPTRCVRE